MGVQLKFRTAVCVTQTQTQTHTQSHARTHNPLKEDF